MLPAAMTPRQRLLLCALLRNATTCRGTAAPLFPVTSRLPPYVGTIRTYGSDTISSVPDFRTGIRSAGRPSRSMKRLVFSEKLEK
ncbi:hypothetical protein A6048_05020 [Dietzia psychralcaliphila]|uniref:Uncharacterized protein n=1 Tax=Dietzia psychralcaliphila TaxID=139021 RepID=A0AAD0JP17_9ACTN|nr:hypothetical protein A6048_05020 [Dietzia psychralcaliphila]